MNKITFLVATMVLLVSSISQANEWVHNVKVNQIGTYQHIDGHFVWFSQHPFSECQQANPSNSTLYFSENNPGGKSLLSVLLAAMMSKSNVDVQVNGCDIVEVYLKSN